MAALGPHAVSLLIGLVAAWACIVVHECGHLVAGLTVGFRFELLVIGPLRLQRDPHGRLRLGLNRDLAMFGGAAGAVPVSAEGLRGASALYAAGGPLASLLFALAAALALPHVGASHHAAVLFLKWIRLISAGIGLVNLVPLANGPFVTDGLRLLRILDRGAKGEREGALFALAALEAGGVRARDWDEELLRRGLAVRDGSMMECQFHLCAYLRELDLGRTAEAGAALDRALALAARAPDDLRQRCVLESAYFDAAHRGRAGVAAASLAAVPAKAAGVTAGDRLRAEAAIALAEGRPGDAARLVGRALAALAPTAATARAWLEALAERTRGALSRA